MDAKMYAPQVAKYHNQNFVVQIDGDTLTLAVVNADSSIKPLTVNATITEAEPESEFIRNLLFQPRYQAIVGGETVTCLRRKEGRFDSAVEEKAWLKERVASKLLDSGLSQLFPGNVYKQYAE